MELNQLVYFRTLAYGNTMQQAAELLNVSQSTLSMSLKKLEQEFDTTFFDRQGRTLKLNEKGRTLLAGTEKILQEIDHLNRVLRSSEEELRSTVTVYADAVDFATEAALLFSRLHPSLRIEVLRSERCLSELTPAPHQADFVISLEPYLHNVEDSRLLISEPMLLLLPPGHPNAASSPVSITDLEGCTLVAGKEGSALRRLFDSFFATAQVSPAKLLEVTDPEVLVTSVFSERGISFIPSSCMTFQAKRSVSGLPRAVARPVREQFCCRNVYMGFLKKEHSPAALLFHDFLLDFAEKTIEKNCFPMEEDFAPQP